MSAYSTSRERHEGCAIDDDLAGDASSVPGRNSRSFLERIFGHSSVPPTHQLDGIGECAEHPVDVGFERALEPHLSSIVHHCSDAFRRPLLQIGGANLADADRAL
jgi:hypothetical protein